MDSNNSVDKNYEFYQKNLKKLKKLYLNEFLVIQDEKVIFHDSNFDDVLKFAATMQAGTYIIQQCDDKDDIQMFHSRVLIN